LISPEMMENIFIRTDSAGNIKADKEKSTEKIAFAIATIRALIEPYDVVLIVVPRSMIDRGILFSKFLNLGIDTSCQRC